jgi:F0F1-type ATP synthase membrane subunit b/b'
MMVPIGVLVVVQLAAFAVLAFVLKRLVLSDTLKAVAQLRQVEAEVGHKEEAMRRRLEENEREFQRKNAEAQEEARKARETAEKELAKTRANLIEESKKERDRIIAEAEKHKDRLRQELLREADKQSVDYAVQMFGMVFSDRISAELNRGFVEELLAALEEVDGDSISVDAEAVELTASHTLADDLRQRVGDLLQRKFHVESGVRERVDPDLIAGIKIKLGSLEIDGTLRNRMGEAIEEARKQRGVSA